MLRARTLLRAGLAAGVSAAFSAAATHSAMSKPALVTHWEGKQGEHSWLEDVLGEDALAWVRRGNEEALRSLGGDPTGSPLYNRIFGILTNKEKIPHLRKIGDAYYNFWTDEENPRGVWRRTDLASYRAGSPQWETVLSVDALNRAEGESWVYKGHTIYRPRDGSPPTRTLLELSRGGADAVVLREFDLVRKRFVPPSEVLLIGTRFPGDDAAASLTDSGYPRTIREWRRGTPLEEAVEVFAGEATDVSVSGHVSRHQGVEFEWRRRALSFYTSEQHVRRRHADGTPAGAWCKLAVPEDATVSQFGAHFLISLRSAWHGHAAGALLATPADALLAVSRSSKPLPLPLTALFAPSERVALERGGYTATRNKLLLSVLNNVKSQLVSLSVQPDGRWREDEATAPAIEGISVSAVDAEEGDDVWLTSWSYLTPTTLSLADVSGGVGPMRSAAAPLRALPPQFDASTHEVTQGSATSEDGTEVPYFVVRPKAAAGPVPTILYGYGGFQISMTPKYVATAGAAWLEEGGCYVEANIRGGGEFGPTWHQAAKKAHRNKAYEDFEAVAEHLVAERITTAPMLACRGGSNGGLLVGNMLVRRPELFGAVVCAVPLLDMRRFNKLLAGASWMAEYGDPDSADWDAFMWRYSAYHHVDGAAHYPPLLMTTSTRDDRVHPYHARAFVRRLQQAGHGATTTYYENIEGGHGGAADPKQQAFMLCLYYEFVKRTVGAALAKDEA